MPVLPTAHASQSYGRRQLEFFATTGHIASPDRRQRASERRFQDMDGGMHTVRLANGDAPMETGDSIAVLRAQSGPDRQSRPVSVINYRTNSWEPTAPEATRALSRAGITRGVNWIFSMIAMALFAIVLVWPELQRALVELNPSMFGGLPQFDLVAFVAGQAGFLVGADPAANIPGLDRAVASTGIFGAEDANGVLLGLGLAVLGLIAYVGRTWRIVWVPLFLISALCAGIVLAGIEGAAGIALIAIGALALFFCIAGLFNRIRDASRFRGRVGRLSEHMLRNPPQESVVSPPPAARSGDGDAALAAAALSAGAVAAAASADDGEDDAVDADEAEVTRADPAEDVAEGAATETETEAANDTDTADEAEPETALADAPDADDAGEAEDAPDAAETITVDGDDAPRTLSAGEVTGDATQTRDARTSAAFGALAAAMESEGSDPVEADDDLPSDAELARARGETVEGEETISLRSPEPETPAMTDRDMSLPEPPPLATPMPGALASAPQATEAESESAEAENDAPDVTPAAVYTAPVAVEDVPDAADTPEPASEDDNDPMMARDDEGSDDEENRDRT